MENKNGYSLAKEWWMFRTTTKEKVTSKHSELYWYIIELNNKLEWKEVIGLPTDFTTEALKMSYNTYKKVLNDLIKWGFIKLIEKSYNQYTCTRIALSNFDKAHTKAHTKAHSPYKTIKTIKTDALLKINTIPDNAK